MVHEAEFTAQIDRLYEIRLSAAWGGGVPIPPMAGCPDLHDFRRAYRECIAATGAKLEERERFLLSMQAQREATGMDG